MSILYEIEIEQTTLMTFDIITLRFALAMGIMEKNYAMSPL